MVGEMPMKRIAILDYSYAYLNAFPEQELKMPVRRVWRPPRQCRLYNRPASKLASPKLVDDGVILEIP